MTIFRPSGRTWVTTAWLAMAIGFACEWCSFWCWCCCDSILSCKLRGGTVGLTTGWTWSCRWSLWVNCLAFDEDEEEEEDEGCIALGGGNCIWLIREKGVVGGLGVVIVSTFWILLWSSLLMAIILWRAARMWAAAKTVSASFDKTAWG